MAVGTATGQVLLYDIRSNKPFFVKDHMYGLPIKDVEFHHQQDLIFSMDSSVVKIWDKNNVGFDFFLNFALVTAVTIPKTVS
jgi:ribosome biogenesis protein ENP2